MHYALLIVETPVSTDTLESQTFYETLKALSEKAKRNKGCEFLTGNVLQIAIDNELDTLVEVIGILKAKKGVQYKNLILDERLEVCPKATK